MFFDNAVSIGTVEHVRDIELSVGWLASQRQVCWPERLDCLLALRRDRAEIGIFKAAQAKGYAVHRESMPAYGGAASTSYHAFLTGSWFAGRRVVNGA